MQKLESSLKNMVLVLVGVALIVGAVLAYINHLTSGPIAEKAAQSLAAGIKSVMGTEELQVAEPEEVKQEFGGKEFSFTIHKCSDKSGKQLGAAVESTTGGFGGDLKVLVGLILRARLWVIPYFRLQRLRVWAPRLLPGSRRTERVASSVRLQRMATSTYLRTIRMAMQ